MTEKEGWDLAIKFEGKSYFAEGTSIDDHGDAHAENGFCNAISTTKVKGTIQKGKITAEPFEFID